MNADHPVLEQLAKQLHEMSDKDTYLAFDRLPEERQRHYRDRAGDLVAIMAPYFMQMHEEAITGSLDRAKELAGPLRIQVSEEKLLELQVALEGARRSPTQILLTTEDPREDPKPQVCRTIYGPPCDDEPMYACLHCTKLQSEPFNCCPICGFSG